HRRLFSRQNHAGLRRRWWFFEFRLIGQRRNRRLLDRFVRNDFLFFDQFGREGSLCDDRRRYLRSEGRRWFFDLFPDRRRNRLHKFRRERRRRWFRNNSGL